MPWIAFHTLVVIDVDHLLHGLALLGGKDFLEGQAWGPVAVLLHLLIQGFPKVIRQTARSCCRLIITR